MSQTAYINDTQGVEITWSQDEGISICASEGDINWNRMTTSSKAKVNNMEGDNKMKRWEKIIERYSSKMMKEYVEEREAGIRKAMIEDDTINAIVQAFHKKEDADKLERDTIFNSCYDFFFDNTKILNKETIKECDKIFEEWKNKCEALTARLSEVKAVLEMTDTYEQMKEVLLQYGILNWDKKEESN